MNQKTMTIIAVAAIVAIGAYFAFGGGYFFSPTETGSFRRRPRSDAMRRA